MFERVGNFIDGAWVAPSTGQYEPNVNPADSNDVIGEFAVSGPEDAKAAVDAAVRAFPAWAATPSPTRGRIVGKALQLLTDRLDLLARTLCREEGKTVGEARGECMKGLYLLEFYAGEGFRMHGKTLPSEVARTFTYTKREPVGPVALITPWNFPFAIPVWKMAPALVAGCTVVLKPAELTPATAKLIVDAFHEAGLPKGVLNFVTGHGEVVGAPLVDDPRIRAVSFTGSTEVGLHIYAQAARRGAKVTCEMGGKNPVVVLDDADLDLAVEGIITGAYGSTGQRCTATSRVVATKGIHDALCEKLVARAKALKVGNGLEPGIQMGPAVDGQQLKQDLASIEKGRAEGATLLTGGRRIEGGAFDRGYFVEPTIFAGVKGESFLGQEEVFGPVLSILKADHFEEALHLANGVRYGLTSSVYTRSANAAMRFIDESEVGMVHVNQATVGGEAQLPFGGIKMTGVGEKEMAEEGLNFFTHLKTVFFDYTGAKRETNIY